MKHYIKSGIFFLLIASSLFAQTALQKEWKIFQQGVQDYKTGEYNKAYKNFSLVISRLGEKSHLLTANYLMLAKTLYKLEQYQKSLEICNQFLKKFPKSKYVDDIQFLQANNYYRLNRVQTASKLWLSLAENAQDPRLRQKALNLARDALRYALDPQGLAHIEQQATTPFQKKLIKYIKAENFYERRNTAAAIKTLEEYKAIPGHFAQLDEKANNLYDFLKNKEHNVVRIAALLPLSGSNKQIGQSILDGAQVALSEFNHLNQMNIQLIPFDYEGRIETALQKMKEIARDPSIVGVFGPLENDITAACAVVADYEKIPLITPTASGKNLRRLSGYTVQLAVPVDIMASKLARFVTDSLNVHRVATLSPIDDYFLDFTNTFVNYLKDNFIEIVAQRWYYPGDNNLTEHFRAIKRIGLKLSFQDSIMAADSTVQLDQIDALYKEYQKEQMAKILHSTNRVKIDSADIPVKSIDAILLPIYREDIDIVASQFAYSNIQAQILGNSDWYDLNRLKRNKSYINGLIFISDNFLDKNNWDYRQFLNKFRMAFHRTPEKYELLGFDNFNFILQAIGNSNQKPERTNFLKMIQQQPKYEGILRRFNIGEKRYNNAARVLKYIYGQLLPLD
jgi:ABC-type branched-subunit amino acid transport system substrate-binding protein